MILGRMSHEYVFSIFRDIYGEFEFFDDYIMRSFHIRFPDGETITIPDFVIMRFTNDADWVDYLLEIFGNKYGNVQISALSSGTTDIEKRIAAINDELDIIRGVRPTPVGYVINVQRTKQLMTELAKLLKEVR
jgi:hypothetical protein